MTTKNNTTNPENLGAARKLKLSLNEHLFNKEAPAGDQYRAEGFLAVEATIEELADAISKGTAYSSQFEDSLLNVIEN